MKAAAFYDKRDIRVVDKPVPEPQADEIRVKVEWCGICGSDMHEYEGGPHGVPTMGHPGEHPLTHKTGLPLVLGHEFSGTIDKMGPQADTEKYKVGQRVCVEPIITCGECKLCRAGFENCCPKMGIIGVADDGGFAEYALARQHRVHLLPDNVSFEVGALIEPLCVAWHAVRQANFTMGQTALVLGGGPVGLAVLKVLHSVGARSVYVSEIADARKEYAKKSGATEVWDPREVDVVQACKDRTPHGLGVDVSFDCAGVPASIKTAIKAVKPRGTILNVALWDRDVPVSLSDITTGEKVLIGTACMVDDFPAVIQAVADGRLNTDGLITGKISLDDIVDQGFEAIARARDKHVKILASPVRR